MYSYIYIYMNIYIYIISYIYMYIYTGHINIHFFQTSLNGVFFPRFSAPSIRQEGKDSFGQEAVDTLIKEIEDKRDQAAGRVCERVV